MKDYFNISAFLNYSNYLVVIHISLCYLLVGLKKTLNIPYVFLKTLLIDEEL